MKDGRQEINISNLDSMPAFRKNALPNQAAEQIRQCSMPPSDYLIMHPDAKLTDAEKQQLIQGLRATFSQ